MINHCFVWNFYDSKQSLTGTSLKFITESFEHLLHIYTSRCYPLILGLFESSKLFHRTFFVLITDWGSFLRCTFGIRSWRERYSPIKSNASWKYCAMFSCGVSFAGICLYLTPGFNLVTGGCFVTFRMQLAPKLQGSTASCVFPSNKCGKSVDAGCDSMSANK